MTARKKVLVAWPEAMPKRVAVRVVHAAAQDRSALRQPSKGGVRTLSLIREVRETRPRGGFDARFERLRH